MSNAPVVRYRQLGKTGLRVSVPIVGAMSFGSDKWAPWVVNEDKAMVLLKAAWDRGVNTIDTANVYSSGVSETIIGKFVKQNNIPRNKILIFTKCHFLCSGDPALSSRLHPEIKEYKEFINQYGLSRQAIFNQVNDSLERLDTTYIDLLQIHRHDPDTTPEETMKALHDLVQSGKVRYIGASSMRTWQFAEYQHVAEKHGWTKFVSMQNEYSLLYREEEREMIPYCNHHGIGLIPWAPLADGYLARSLKSAQTERSKDPARKIREADEAIIQRVEELAEKKGWKMSQVALAWIDKKVSSPIVGMSSPERLDDANVTGKELTDEEVKYLEEPYVPKAVRGHE